MEHKFVYLHNQLRKIKKQGSLPYSNSKLGNVISKLEEIGFLIPIEAAKYNLTEDYKENLTSYIEKAISSKL